MIRKKIAVIDDERHIVQLLSIELKATGYEVVAAFDGAAGLELIRREKPDLILLDLMMPKVDGFEVLETLNADARTKDIPVILLTARDSDYDIKRCLELGIKDYIMKPFHAELLMKKIKRIV